MGSPQEHKNTSPILVGGNYATEFITQLIDDLPEILEQLHNSEYRNTTAGDEVTTHYVDRDGDLSLEGEPVTEWMVSDLTCADILEGDGR